MTDLSPHSPPEKIVEAQLDDRINTIEEAMQGDVVTFVGSLLHLRIEGFGENPVVSESIRVYGKLLKDYMMRLRHIAVLHRRGSYVPLTYS